jgi:hypothetical protein
MAIEGPLKELNIHDVFQLLDLGRKTGVLRVTSELRQNAGVVHFDRGAVIAAHITSNPHVLGELLLRSGKLREEDLARARALQAAGDRRRLGEILVAIDAVTQRLDRCVRAQVSGLRADKLVGGYFSFVEGDRSAPASGTGRHSHRSAAHGGRAPDRRMGPDRDQVHLGMVPRLRVPEDRPRRSTWCLSNGKCSPRGRVRDVGTIARRWAGPIRRRPHHLRSHQRGSRRAQAPAVAQPDPPGRPTALRRGAGRGHFARARVRGRPGSRRWICGGRSRAGGRPPTLGAPSFASRYEETGR